MPPRPLSAALALAALLVSALPAAAQRAVATPWPAPPDKLYAELFVDVQTAQVYADQKTFVDATPRDDPATILASYRAQRGAPGFSLKAFVDAHFEPPADTPVDPPSGQGLREHIAWLWPALTRDTAHAPPGGSLLPLPRPYVVPGGRFREGYYWDSWFTMLGLQEAGREDLVDDMIENFASEIDRFGHIPNGNRSYYLSRSQPPFFALMVELAAAREGDAVVERWLPEMRREHAYWMRGAEALKPGQAAARVVRLADGALLNRYWDDEDTPRPESYLQDVATAKQSPDRPPAEVWRDLRAAAESGWDFSSRWFGDGRSLATIRTTAIVPVDLNALLLELERAIAKGCTLAADQACAAQFDGFAKHRVAAIEHHLWHPHGYYADYDWRLGKLRDEPSAAMLYPLFVGAAPRDRAARTLRTAECALLGQGGLAATTAHTGQQWDAPNGWAPLQWIADQSARRYGRPDLAQALDARFLASVERVYGSEHKLVEKYVVDGSGGSGGGGEYPLQDGFGWTNGVVVSLLDLRDQDRAAPAPRRTPARCAR
ncbi:alpha,alpha-trehalase TreA [Scleromatobacter humisilvae]|uniref:Putative periplasmic trehalase n=1 Tax=Scleromatobacter humisilvae TaxID=2897159 RepID=A0A9X1YIH9_9BURK|nr:alpha,alpha-trehalase TreA [Scleromatobacter humisilvae]MCK9686546.1 alpha,alpha-trehalase TreA [Scleromatobacter humisilvae]